MRKIYFLSVSFMLLFQTSCMHAIKAITDLNKAIYKKLPGGDTHIAVAFEDLQTGETILINAKDNYHAASTMKTPVLIELYKQSAGGKFSMSDSIAILNSFRSIVDGSEFSLDSADDSEFDLYKKVGEKVPIDTLAYKMIILSSNLATNILIDLVKPDSVMKTMRSIGANDIKILRGVEDNKAFEKGLNNSVTAQDLMLIYSLMARDRLVGSGDMIKILLDQRFNEVIPARLPKDVKVAHKTGFITGVQHDSGIVFLPNGKKYVLVLLSKFNPDNNKEVVETMAGISKMIYDYMNK